MRLSIAASIAAAALIAGCSDPVPTVRDLPYAQWRTGDRDSLRQLLSEKEREALRYGVESIADTARAAMMSVGELIEIGEPIRQRVSGEHGNGTLQ
jgi:hypothetical protein